MYEQASFADIPIFTLLCALFREQVDIKKLFQNLSVDFQLWCQPFNQTNSFKCCRDYYIIQNNSGGDILCRFIGLGAFRVEQSGLKKPSNMPQIKIVSSQIDSNNKLQTKTSPKILNTRMRA
ncbi:unnamed protein product [Paramecium pentaurelia]|uniref:Uncharacterized protein n=1 Tax=Paramecium pentaurelia TaxID=43138 RepID=A0A8S1XX33_9CILI|nr:unnamed protein product [Paramecium pentaurelia]